MKKYFLYEIKKSLPAATVYDAYNTASPVKNLTVNIFLWDKGRE